MVEAEDQTERIHSVTEPQERTSRMDQIAGSEPARGLMPRGASHRPDPMSTSLYSTPTASSGAALVGANDREAPHTHSVTTQRQREAMLHHADDSHHHHRHWLHHSAHVDRFSHELDES